MKALKEQESGRTADDVCRELGISSATFYRWKSRYGGADISELRRLKELEAENARLKRMFADLSLDHSILKDVLSKKGWGPAGEKS